MYLHRLYPVPLQDPATVRALAPRHPKSGLEPLPNGGDSTKHINHARAPGGLWVGSGIEEEVALRPWADPTNPHFGGSPQPLCACWVSWTSSSSAMPITAS